jgi:tRNA threonylcarbamoyl adenosine modification protein YeaZ
VLVLGLDTSTPAVTVAVGTVRPDGAVEVLAERTEVAVNRHGELVAPMVAEVLAAAGAARRDLGAVAAGAGPGPFTGLRVGLVTVASLADALDVPAYAACSLDAIAAQHSGALVVATDARRREVYWARYDARGDRIEGPQVQRPADLAATLPAGSVIAGAGGLLYRDVFADLAVEEGAPYPAAAALLRLVAPRAAAGAPADPLTPLYLRRPDAVPPGPPKAVTPA